MWSLPWFRFISPCPVFNAGPQLYCSNAHLNSWLYNKKCQKKEPKLKEVLTLTQQKHFKRKKKKRQIKVNHINNENMKLLG